MRILARCTKGIVPAALALGLVLATGEPAHAVSVTSCDTTCTSNCDLAVDLNCLAYAVTLANGADFDFKGHTIGCSFAGSCGGSAIRMTGNNSIVKDSGNASGVKGGLRGGYVVGVDCASKPGSQVTGIVSDGVEGTAIKDCSIVDHNVLLAGGEDDEYATFAIERNVGISTSSDAITDNYVSWFGRGIMAGGNKPIDIEHNVLVVGPGPNPNAVIATSSTTAAATVRYNTLLTEQDDFLLLAAGASTTASANFCDGTKSDCASCIAAGQCEPFEHAVCGPTTYRLRVIGIGDQNQADSVVPSGVDIQYRWTLVNDYPDTGNIISLAGATAVAYVGTGIGIGTDLFQVALYNAPDSMQFEKCTLRSHMMAEGAPGGTSPTWLVMKHAGTQSNGSQIDVQPTFIQEYTREMTTNPFTNQPWNSDDFTSSIYQIGVRNNVGTGRGITFLDLLLECQ